MKFFIVTIYLILGIFFMGMFKDSSGKPFVLMAWLWPIFVTILLICKIFEIIYRTGEKIGENQMNLIEKWKNRKTKKKLREENIQLRAKLEANLKSSFPVVTVGRNIQKVKFSMEVNQIDLERGLPTEYIKRNIVNGISEYIEPFIEYDFRDSTEYGGRIYTGIIYIATGDKKHEQH